MFSRTAFSMRAVFAATLVTLRAALEPVLAVQTLNLGVTLLQLTCYPHSRWSTPRACRDSHIGL
jgi:hypothetical protein